MTLSKSLQILKNQGFEVPENALTYALDQERRQRGLKSIWQCNCGHIYESELPILQYDHNCGKAAKEIWSSS